jgi:hypothetical protein
MFREMIANPDAMRMVNDMARTGGLNPFGGAGAGGMGAGAGLFGALGGAAGAGTPPATTTTGAQPAGGARVSITITLLVLSFMAGRLTRRVLLASRLRSTFSTLLLQLVRQVKVKRGPPAAGPMTSWHDYSN